MSDHSTIGATPARSGPTFKPVLPRRHAVITRGDKEYLRALRSAETAAWESTTSMIARSRSTVAEETGRTVIPARASAASGLDWVRRGLRGCALWAVLYGVWHYDQVIPH